MKLPGGLCCIQVYKWKDTAEEEGKAKEAVARDFSMQMNELLASLDKFKLENQKTLLNKENELEELRKKLSDATIKVQFLSTLLPH